MKFSALVLVALSAFSLAEDTEEYPESRKRRCFADGEEHECYCDTREESPMVHHVEWVIDNIRSGDNDPNDDNDETKPGGICHANSSDIDDCCSGAQITWSHKPGDLEHTGGAVFTLCTGPTGDCGRGIYGASPNPIYLRFREAVPLLTSRKP